MNALALAAIASGPIALPLADDIALTLVPEKAASKIGSYAPLRAKFAAEKPATITHAPGDLVAPTYGVFEIANEGGLTYHFILDEPEGQPARLFIDANGNGDLTDDPAVNWNAKHSGEGDAKRTMYSGVGRLNLGTVEQPYVVAIGLYRFDKNDPQRAALKDILMYYRDYAVQGKVTLGGKTYDVLISDDRASGDFRGKELAADADPKAGSGVTLFVDVNANGKFDKRGEQFDIRKPFNIGGTTYEISNVARNGLTLAVAESDKTVEQIALAPDLSVGKKITPFEAQSTEGKTVAFPSDYKGKIVMIDFWATWCGPCMAEVPGLVATYNKFHDQGFEVLGISLDNERSMAKLKPVTAEKGMTWTQVADGKYWDAAIARLYVVDSIPACWLVDGDTGEILATESDLRGEKLAATIEKHLASKRNGS